MAEAIGAPPEPGKPFRWSAGSIALAVAVVLYLMLLLFVPLLGLLGHVFDAGILAIIGELGKTEVLDGLGRTALITAIAALVNGIAGIGLALVLVRQRFFGLRFIDAVLDLPLALPPVMIGLSFLLVFGRGGLLEPLIAPTGLRIIFALPGLILAVLFVTLPFTVREVANVLGELGSGEEDAAATLGASRWQTFRWVTLPNIRNAASYGVMLTAARSLGEFGAVLVLGGAIGGKTQTATTFIYTAMEERWETAAYGTSLVLIALSMAFIILLRQNKRGRC